MHYLRLVLLLLIIFITDIPASAQRTNIFQIQYNKSETDSLLKLLDKTTDNHEKVLLYKALCWKLRNTNAEDKALYYADQGIALARKINFKKAEADITRFKGMITWNFKHQNITNDLYAASLELSKEIGDREGEAYSYDRLGTGCYYRGDLAEARQYFDRAQVIFKEIKSDEGLSYVYSHLNWVFTAQKKYDEALKYGRLALALREALKKDEGISNSLADLGITFKDINTDSARIYITKAVEFAKAKNLELPLAEYSLILSEIFLKIKNYDKALQYALQSYNLATENNSKRQIEQTSAAIANIYEKQHDYSKALRFLHIYLDIKNSLFNEEINKRIIEQEVEYKYEKEKQAATDKARLTKVILTAVIILLVIVAAMIIYKNRVSQILRVENLRRKISSDLHDDIGATLSSINIYSELAKREKENTAFLQTIQEQATSTVSALDDLVWSINPNNDNLKVLIERMRSYALPVLLDNKIKAEFIAEMKDEEVAISLEKRRSIYFAFKEMVANVLKHANCRSCVITVKQSSSNLTIEVTDDGRGFDLNNINHQRNGLRNLQTRAKENGGHFSVVSEVGKGTASSFSVALKSRNFAM